MGHGHGAIDATLSLRIEEAAEARGFIGDLEDKNGPGALSLPVCDASDNMHMGCSRNDGRLAAIFLRLLSR